MTLVVNKMDGRVHINTARHEGLSKKNKVMWYKLLQKDYQKDRVLDL